MKFAILLLVLFITPAVPRFHNDDEENNDIYELADLLKDRFKHQKHHPKPSYRPEELDNDDNDNERDEDSSPEYPSVFPGEEVHSSRKKVQPDSEPDDDDGATTRSSSTSPPSMTEASDPSACVDKYETRPEQLVKVKDLTDGAHLIRYVLIDKRTLPAGEKVNDACMLDCCSEATCDLAMLSEQPTHDGYKCYLFACNGGCTLASHQDYTVMTRTSILAAPKVNPSPATSTVGVNRAPRRSALFRNTAVIIFLVFGIVSTAVLLFLLVKHCRQPRRYNRKLKNYSVDEDYLINGLYL